MTKKLNEYQIPDPNSNQEFYQKINAYFDRLIVEAKEAMKALIELDNSENK